MKKDFVKRTLSGVIAVIMVITMIPAYAFADEEKPEEKETKNILVFGDSTSSGYGLPGHISFNSSFDVNNNDLETWTTDVAASQGRGRISDYSHPWQLKTYLMSKGYDVHLTSMTIDGMRTNELRGLLDEKYALRTFAIENEKVRVQKGNDESDEIGFVTDHLRKYVDCTGRGGATVIEDGVEKKVWESGQSRLPGSDAYKRMVRYTREQVAKADVIVVDVCTNNFGTYLGHRVAGIANTEGYEATGNYRNQTIDDLDGISEDMRKRINSVKSMLIDTFGVKDSEIADVLLDALIYCYADCVINFSADIEMLREINPDAKIIAVGVYNTVQGVKLSFGGQEVDFGGFADLFYSLVNRYIKSLDKNSSNYYYADLSSGVEIITDDIASTSSYEDVDPKLMNNMMGELIRYLTPEYENIDAMAKAYAETDDPAMIAEVKEQLSVKLKKLIKDSSNQASGDMEQIMASLSTLKHSDSELSRDIKAYLADDTGEYEVSDDTKVIILIAERFFFDHGIGTHPSVTGCGQKSDAVIKAYEKEDSAFEESKKEIQKMMEDLVELLRQTGAKDDIDAIIAKINQIQDALAMMDEAQASMEELKELKALKDQLIEYYGEALDLLGITTDDLIAQGKFIYDHVDPVWVAEQIRLMQEIINEWPELQEKYSEKLEEYAEKIADAINKTVDELIKKKELFEDSEVLKKMIETIEVLRDVAEKMPKSEEEFKALLEEQLERAEALIEDAAASISQDLADQIREIADKLKDAVEKEDYQAIIDELLPIGQKLLEIGEAVSGLPEYQAAMDEYIETSNAAMAGLQDRVKELERMAGKLQAKYVKVDMKVAAAFGAKSSKINVTWAADENAAGYVVKVDGKEVEAKETKKGLSYEQTGIKVGQKYTYEITPYVMAQIDGETETFYGKTYKKTFVPKVSLKKVTLKKAKAARESIKATWKKVTEADGYQISYKLGKKTKYKTVKGAKKVTLKVRKLKSGKKYTVKVRAYKTVNGKKYFGKWSKAKKAKVK